MNTYLILSRFKRRNELCYDAEYTEWNIVYIQFCVLRTLHSQIKTDDSPILYTTIKGGEKVVCILAEGPRKVL